MTVSHIVNVEFQVEVTGDFTAEEAEQIVTEGIALPPTAKVDSLDVWAKPTKTSAAAAAERGLIHAVHS